MAARVREWGHSSMIVQIRLGHDASPRCRPPKPSAVQSGMAKVLVEPQESALQFTKWRAVIIGECGFCARALLAHADAPGKQAPLVGEHAGQPKSPERGVRSPASTIL